MLNRTLRTAVLFCLQMFIFGVVKAQTVSEIVANSPLIINGVIGTQNTFRYSTSGDGFGSPLSNSVYANVNIGLYGVTMPFSLYYTNGDLDFNHPHLAFSLSPSYKHWRGYIGLSSMDFSTYIMNMSFNGVGVEYKDDRYNGAFFYGCLRHAVNASMSEVYAPSPQYKRMGWGFKVGYTEKDIYYVNVYFLRAYDNISSLNESLRSYVSPKESFVVGVNGGYHATSWLSLSANAATSFLTTDTRDAEAAVTGFFDNIFDTRLSSLSRFAGDLNAHFSLPFLKASLSYKYVQPEYNSLATYYMPNNYQSVGVTANTFLFKKVALSGALSLQSDNLSDEQLYTTHGCFYNICASARLTDQLGLSAMYNGYVQRQTNGVERVNDSTRVHRRMSSYSITPSYSFETEGLSHSVSLSVNHTDNVNLNDYISDNYDVRTNAVGLSYSVDVPSVDMFFGASLSHQKTVGYDAEYRSCVCTLSASRSMLEDHSLNVNASFSFCDNKIKGQSGNFTLGIDLSASYQYKKDHMFSANIGLNKYGNVIPVYDTSDISGTDFTVSFNYAYIFSIVR